MTTQLRDETLHESWGIIRPGSPAVQVDYPGWRAAVSVVHSPQSAASALADSVSAAVTESLGRTLVLTMVPRLNELQRRLEQLEASANSALVMISEFPGYRLSSPLSVQVVEEDGAFLAQAPELDLWADGASRGEALDELKGLLASLADDLASTPDVRLGPRPQRWKAFLARVAQPV